MRRKKTEYTDKYGEVSQEGAALDRGVVRDTSEITFQLGLEE